MFSLIAAVAIATQLSRSIHYGASISNFFSFFTIESNILALFVFALGSTLSGKTWDIIRGGAALYMTTTGLVYIFLLAGLEHSLQTTIPWVNAVLHYVMPAMVFIDWFIDRPRSHISFKKGLVWLIFPLAYVVYSLIRGAIVHWYPYPFLDPTEQGYVGVFSTSLVIAPIMTAFVWLFAQASKQKKR